MVSNNLPKIINNAISKIQIDICDDAKEDYGVTPRTRLLQWLHQLSKEIIK